VKAGQASSTALLIARSTVLASGNPDWKRFFNPRAVQLCRAFVRDLLVLGEARLRLYQQAWFRHLVGLVEGFTLPGIQLHYALRKQKIEEWVRAALAHGAKNVQVTGAGFDTLALRLAEEFADALFLEVDHPDTQQAKRRALAGAAKLPPNLSFQALDLGSGTSAADPGSGFLNPRADTVVVAEGLLMYLSEPDVREFFARLRSQFPARLQVVFTFMTPDQTQRIRFHNSSHLVDQWLDFRGEPFTWGISRAEVGAYLADLGFDLIELAGHVELRQQFLAELPGKSPDLAEGECLAVAEASA